MKRMKNRYITVKCPSCRSVIQLKAESVRTEYFYCPVCEEGEIEHRLISPFVRHNMNRNLTPARVLVRV
ncbi:MAG: hypothetical protein A2Y92_03185 [Chloroflexi bacterium RBG_13_57_8]|nr:MAG: hypothetical protein A2Y92_03185 [Chloroflexi bacterium RBG_13_57_8]